MSFSKFVFVLSPYFQPRSDAGATELKGISFLLKKKNKRISQNLIDGTANLCAKPKISLSLFDCDLYKGTKLFLTGLINAIFVES